MDQPIHQFAELFKQLGLPPDERAIQQFLTAHSPLAPTIELPDAPFWSPAQAQFLEEQQLEDADWAELVDQLNLALRR